MSDYGAALPRLRPDFSRRSAETEWLDQEDLDPDELAAVLRDLARFNGAMLGRWPILRWLTQPLEAFPEGRTASLVDVGCGYGDLLRAIRRWARRRGKSIALRGLDVNAATIRIARAATDRRDQIDFELADALQYRPTRPVDFVISSLVAHHLSDAGIVEFLRWMEATAKRGWLVCDLQRHPVPYHFIGLTGRLSSLHPAVIHDGRISVARSLTRAEWQEHLQSAGIAPGAVTIRWSLFRWLIGRLR